MPAHNVFDEMDAATNARMGILQDVLMKRSALQPTCSSGVTAKTYGTDAGGLMTILTLVDVSIALPDLEPNNGGGVKLLTFPSAVIHIESVLADLTLVQSGIAAAATFSLSVGTALNDDADLSDTDEANLIAAEELVFASSTKDLQKAAAPSEADGIQDGSSTAIAVYLNAIEATTDPSDDGTLTVNGTMVIRWASLGAYS